MGEAHGLIISYSSTIGWSITTLNEGAKAFVAENGKQGAFILTREQHKPPEPPKMPVEPLTARTGKQTGESRKTAQRTTQRAAIRRTSLNRVRGNTFARNAAALSGQQGTYTLFAANVM